MDVVDCVGWGCGGRGCVWDCYFERWWHLDVYLVFWMDGLWCVG